MKKLFLFIALVFFLSTSIFGQWHQSLTGQGSAISEISIVDNNILWVIDQNRDSISYSTDGGVNWTSKELHPEWAINDFPGGICAINDSTVFLMKGGGSERGIYKTTDRGDSWVKQTSGFNDEYSFPNFIYFWNVNEGIAVGDPKPNGYFEIYRTTDAGINWVPVPDFNMPVSEPEEITYNTDKIFRVRGDYFYFSTSKGRIFFSDNKGLNWSVIDTPTTYSEDNYNYFSFDFKDENNGLCLCSQPYPADGLYELYSTHDGGQSWSKINTTAKIVSIKYIPFLDAYAGTNFYLPGLSFSNTNGLIWSEHPSFEDTGLFEVVFSEDGTVFIGGWRYVFRSTNCGGENPKISDLTITGSNSYDLKFSASVEQTSAENINNYYVWYRDGGYKKINVLTAERDHSKKSLVHLTTSEDLPFDTLSFCADNVYDFNGLPVIKDMFKLLHTSIKTIEETPLKIYPNPAFDNINIALQNGKSASVNIYSLEGKLIKQQKINKQGTIDIKDLPKGIYIVNVENDNRNYSSKLIKLK